VRGVIEDRGKFLDPNAPDIPDIYKYNKLEYGFELSTSADDYSVTYCNKTGQIIIGGVEQINLTSSDFSVNGNALSLFFSLSSADETYTSLTATTTYIKANLSSVDSGFTYLSDVAPNPPLSVIEAFAYDTGLIGEGIQFNATIEPLTGQPPYTYHWDFGDQGTSTQLNPTHVYTKAGHYTYTFTVTDQAGNTASQTGTITIKP
jgi:PKD repeat protein